MRALILFPGYVEPPSRTTQLRNPEPLLSEYSKKPWSYPIFGRRSEGVYQQTADFKNIESSSLETTLSQSICKELPWIIFTLFFEREADEEYRPNSLLMAMFIWWSTSHMATSAMRAGNSSRSMLNIISTFGGVFDVFHLFCPRSSIFPVPINEVRDM